MRGGCHPCRRVLGALWAATLRAGLGLFPGGTSGWMGEAGHNGVLLRTLRSKRVSDGAGPGAPGACVLTGRGCPSALRRAGRGSDGMSVPGLGDPKSLGSGDEEEGSGRGAFGPGQRQGLSCSQGCSPQKVLC